MKSLAKNTFFNIFYNVANLLFPIFTSMYVSRILLPEGMGRVSYAQNIVSYFVVLASLGIPTHGIREIAKVRDDEQQKNRVFTELFVINGMTTAVMVIVFLAAVLCIEEFSQDRILYLCCGLQLLLNTINIDWFYKGYEEYTYIVIRSLCIKVVSIFAIFLLIHTREDYIVYAFISGLAVTGNHLFNIVHVRKYVSLDFRHLQLKRHLRPILILAVGSLMGTVYAKVDVTMLGAMLNKSFVGYYSSAHRLVDMVLNVAISASAVFLPRLSTLFNQDKERFGHYVGLGLRTLFFMVPPAFVGLNLIAEPIILFVYGEAFLPSVTTIRILSFLILIKSFGDLLCYQVAVAIGNEKKRLPAYVIAMLLNILLNSLWIPKYAQNGAAIASIVSEVFLNGYMLVVICRIVNIPVTWRPIIQAVFTTCLMAVCVLWVGKIQGAQALRCFLMVSSGAAVYAISNIILGNEIATRIKVLIFEAVKTKAMRRKA